MVSPSVGDIFRAGFCTLWMNCGRGNKQSRFSREGESTCALERSSWKSIPHFPISPLFVKSFPWNMVLTPRKFNQTSGARTRLGEKVIFRKLVHKDFKERCRGGSGPIQALSLFAETQWPTRGLDSLRPAPKQRQFKYFSLKSFF